LNAVVKYRRCCNDIHAQTIARNGAAIKRARWKTISGRRGHFIGFNRRRAIMFEVIHSFPLESKTLYVYPVA